MDDIKKYTVEDIEKLQGKLSKLIDKSIDALERLSDEKIDPTTISSLKETTEPQTFDNLLCETFYDDYDPDSSPIAWKYYQNRYHFQYSEKTETKNKRIIKEVTYNNINIDISGDCSFNFNPGKVKKFKELLGENHDDISTLLDDCNKMHHSLWNFDLIPRTGALNNVKGKLYYHGLKNDWYIYSSGTPKEKYDRLDSFLYFLDKSIKERNEINETNNANINEIGNYLSHSIFKESLATENFSVLYSLIDNFKNSSEYVNVFYPELNKDKKLLNDLIESGQKPIDSTERVIEYIELAIRFWEAKEAYFNNPENIVAQPENQ